MNGRIVGHVRVFVTTWWRQVVALGLLLGGGVGLILACWPDPARHTWLYVAGAVWVALAWLAGHVNRLYVLTDARGVHARRGFARHRVVRADVRRVRAVSDGDPTTWSVFVDLDGGAWRIARGAQPMAQKVAAAMALHLKVPVLGVSKAAPPG